MGNTLTVSWRRISRSPMHGRHPSGAAAGQAPTMAACLFSPDRRRRSPLFRQSRERWGRGEERTTAVERLGLGGSFEKMHGWSLSRVGPRVDVAAVKAPRELVSGGQTKLGPRVNNLERIRTQMCILKELGPSRHFWERIRTALAFYSIPPVV